MLSYRWEVRDMKIKFSSKVTRLLYSFAITAATVAANTTCCRRYYQEEMSPQLNSLRKYHDK